MTELRYIERNAEGIIVGEYSHPYPGKAEEILPEDHPEVVAFRNAMARYGSPVAPLPAPRKKGGPRRVA